MRCAIDEAMQDFLRNTRGFLLTLSALLFSARVEICEFNTGEHKM